MRRNRKTIADSALFEGVGIHSGKRATVQISPLADMNGIHFSFGSRRYAITEAKPADTKRNTTITFPGGESLQTVEHLLAAIAGTELDDVLIECDGLEIPVLDGSALLFAQKILEIGFLEKDDLLEQRALFAPVCIDAGRSSIVAFPSEETRMTYIIDYPGTAVGTEMKDVILTPQTFLAEVAPARTFGFLSEVEALREAGLGLGGDMENVIIIGDDGPLNTVGYRIDRECAAHKILDLMGDLTLAGDPVRAHYVCVCGGHWLHSKLVDRLKGIGRIC